MQPASKLLNAANHDRDRIRMTYVYPVVSRRSGGVSIGINLNPDNACNWRCIYCQVPGLKRGTAPAVDLIKLEAELRQFLHEIVHGSFMQEHVPVEGRRINDIALSGNGEPTSAGEFEQVIDLIGTIIKDAGLPETLKLILITNGSLVDRLHVQRGLKKMARLNGEIWFKLDSVTREGRRRINNTRMSLNRLRENLQLAAQLCPTWLQTCVFQIDGAPPGEEEIESYLRFISDLLQDNVSLKGVMLYGIARPSMQPERSRLSKIEQGWVEVFSERIRKLGLTVRFDS